MKKTVLLSLCAFALAVACSDDGPIGLVQDPADLFWSLELDQNAINLATDQSRPEYYTHQLVGTPRRLDGSPLQLTGEVPIQFMSSDTNRVTVTADGLITAIAPTAGSNPVRIVATMTAGRGPVTNADTAFVIVTEDVRPIETFSIQPYRTTFGIGYDTTMAARAVGPGGLPVTGIRVSYESSLPKVATYDEDGVLRPMTMGTVMLRANTLAYGVGHRDSVELTISEPEVFQVINDIVIGTDGDISLEFRPVEITIEAGQGIAFIAGNAGCVYGVEFDDPTHVGPSPVDGATGNISFFCGIGAREIRMFDVPGTYTYDAGPNFGFPTLQQGKIIVTP